MKKIFFIFCFFISGIVNGQTRASSFVFLLGSDTVGYEQYTRSVDKITGNIITLSPKVTTVYFAASLNSSGAVTHFEYVSAIPGSATKIMEREMTFSNDTLVRQTLSMSGKLDSFFSRSFVIRPGSVPHFDFDISMYEQMIQEAVRSGKDSFPVDRLTNAPIRSFIKQVEPGVGVYKSMVFGSPVVLKTNTSNEVTRYDATGSTIKIIAERIPSFDFDNLVAASVQKEKANGIMGTLSTADTIKTSIKGSDLVITYGRPYRRGRTIFGDIVPWNKVWRTGANFATHISSSKDLVFGSYILPAGRYTLWTLPMQDSVKLIINKAVNIFGTQYNPRNDVIRLDMGRSELQGMTEQFTIELKETPEGGKLMFKWDHTVYSIEFRIGN